MRGGEVGGRSKGWPEKLLGSHLMYLASMMSARGKRVRGKSNESTDTLRRDNEYSRYGMLPATTACHHVCCCHLTDIATTPTTSHGPEQKSLLQW